MRKFAEQRGLEVARRDLGEVTPGLLTGSAPRDVEGCAGELADGLHGTLAQHLFESRRGRRESTVVLAAVPGAVAFAPALVCRDAPAMGDADLAQLPAERWQRVELESGSFNRRFRLWTLAGQDEVWLRELFSPSLVDWLDRGPQGLSFELNEGHLCVSLPGHLDDPQQLAELCSLTAELARRIRDEAADEEEHPDLFSEAAELRDLDSALAAVRWSDPPATVSEAIEAYRRVAGRRPRVLLGALMWALLAAAVAGGAVALAAGPLAGLIAAALVALPVGVAARFVRSYRHRFGSVGVQRVGLEAFVREYARARGLQVENRWAAHAANRELAMPGVTDYSLAGELPGVGPARFVMFGNAPEMRSRGEEIAYTTDRPLAASGLLVNLDREPTPEQLEQLPALPEEYNLELAGTKLLVWRPVLGHLVRTAAGSDRFVERAAGVVSQVREVVAA